jgi:hypothetical protein
MEKLKALILKLNKNGVPLPMATDPKTGVGSLTVTMVVVSFGICALGVLGKASKVLGEVDLTAAHSLLVISLSAYLGRKVMNDGKNVTMDASKQKEKEEDNNG